MKIIKSILSTIGWLFMIFIALAYLTDFDNISNEYANLDEVKQDKAITSGWVPKCLPEDSYNIREKHNIDINSGKGRFQCKNCELIDAIKISKEHNNLYLCEDFIIKVEKDYNKFFLLN